MLFVAYEQRRKEEARDKTRVLLAFSRESSPSHSYSLVSLVIIRDIFAKRISREASCS